MLKYKYILLFIYLMYTDMQESFMNIFLKYQGLQNLFLNFLLTIACHFVIEFGKAYSNSTISKKGRK
jgi:hypothetical protein